MNIDSKDTDTELYVADSDETDKKELKKHTAIVHCSNTLSLLERKISNVLLFHAYPNLFKVQEHEITIGYLCKLISYYGNNYDAIKSAVRRLITTLVEWNLTDAKTNKEDWTASSILASIRIAGGKVWYSYSPRMCQLLYSPSMYAKINLVIQSRFNSSYGLALYENCIRYKGLKETRWFDLETFRKLMGVADSQYVRFNDFKKRVLDKAIDEINTLSDLNVAPEYIKTGRTVMKIKFILKERNKKKKFSLQDKGKIDESTSPPISDEVKALLHRLTKNYAISRDMALALIREYGASKVEEKIIQVESSHSYITGKIKALSGYLIEALKQDYLIPKSSQLAVNEKARENDLLNEQKRKEAKQIDLLKQEYSEYCSKKRAEIISKLDNNDLVTLKKAFEEDLRVKSNHFVLEKYKKNDFSNKFVIAEFHHFISRHYPTLFSSILSFDNFLLEKKKEKNPIKKTLGSGAELST